MPPVRKSSPSPLPTPSSAVTSPEAIEIGAGAFKNTCLQLLDQVAEGGPQIIVTKRGGPVAGVVRGRPETPSAFGFLRGTLLSTGDLVSPDHEAWGEEG